MQIHHIDENRTNNVIENLAVLCRLCHDRVHDRLSFGRKYSKGEIEKYKNSWEVKCSSINEGNDKGDFKKIDNKFFVLDLPFSIPQNNKHEFLKNLSCLLYLTQNEIIYNTEVMINSDRKEKSKLYESSMSMLHYLKEFYNHNDTFSNSSIDKAFVEYYSIAYQATRDASYSANYYISFMSNENLKMYEKSVQYSEKAFDFLYTKLPQKRIEIRDLIRKELFS